MTQPDQTRAVPHRILLATDLSVRSDRALDRAVSLAREWDADLVAVHALEEVELASTGPDADLPSWRRGPDPAHLATESLRRDLADAHRPFSVLVERGDPGEVILAAAEARRCDLIVTAVSRDELLGPFRVGSVVDALLRKTSLPVLIVRQRPRHPYGKVVVATDVSEASRLALHRAVALFPHAVLQVFHAYEPPLTGVMGDPTAYRQSYGRMIAGEFDTFLKETGIQCNRIDEVLVERGDPALLIGQYARDAQADLVVMGAERKGALLDLLLGSTSRSILEALPCDALIVPGGS